MRAALEDPKTPYQQSVLHRCCAELVLPRGGPAALKELTVEVLFQPITRTRRVGTDSRRDTRRFDGGLPTVKRSSRNWSSGLCRFDDPTTNARVPLGCVGVAELLGVVPGDERFALVLCTHTVRCVLLRTTRTGPN
jgi:hypothetical protein